MHLVSSQMHKNEVTPKKISRKIESSEYVAGKIADEYQEAIESII